MRSDQAFTKRQLRFLIAIYDKIQIIDDPETDIISHETYDWRIDQTAQFGRIPKLKFSPNTCHIKADIVKEAGLIDPDRKKEIENLRKAYGFKKLRNSQARLFEAEWNNLMFKAKKAIFIIGYLNNLFSQADQPMAPPIALLQEIVLSEKSNLFLPLKPSEDQSPSNRPPKTHENKRMTPYDKEIEALE